MPPRIEYKSPNHFLGLEKNIDARAQLAVLLEHFTSFGGTMSWKDVTGIFIETSGISLSVQKLTNTLKKMPGNTPEEKLLNYSKLLVEKIGPVALRQAEFVVDKAMRKRSHLNSLMHRKPITRTASEY